MKPSLWNSICNLSVFEPWSKDSLHFSNGRTFIKPPSHPPLKKWVPQIETEDHGRLPWQCAFNLTVSKATVMAHSVLLKDVKGKWDLISQTGDMSQNADRLQVWNQELFSLKISKERLGVDYVTKPLFYGSNKAESSTQTIMAFDVCCSWWFLLLLYVSG